MRLKSSKKSLQFGNKNNMEDLIYKLQTFTPLNASSDMKQYLDHQFKHLSACMGNNLYSSSFYHLHLIYITLIYIQVARIFKHITSKERKCALIGFAREENALYSKEKEEITASTLVVINEKTVFRFFRLIIDEDNIIGQASSLVEKRNKLFHVYSSKILTENEKYTNILKDYTDALEKIIDKSTDFLNKIYKKTLTIFKDSKEITEDDLVNEFGDFSIHELKILTHRKNDLVAKKVKELYGYKNDE